MDILSSSRRRKLGMIDVEKAEGRVEAPSGKNDKLCGVVCVGKRNRLRLTGLNWDVTRTIDSA